MPTNKKLFRKHEEALKIEGTEEVSEVGLPRGESSKELIRKWSNLNIVRGCFPLVASVLGTWVTI